MILPTKGITPDRSLLGLGAQVLGLLDGPDTVSSVWFRLRQVRGETAGYGPLSYDWFVLALDLLSALGTIGRDADGLIVRTAR